jgi:4-aminobutyrate aminotransferase-like enzyme
MTGATVPGVVAGIEAPAPRIVTPYPGPRSREVLTRLRAVEGSGLRTAGADWPLVVERASGSVLEDPDGNTFVDLYASFAAATLGHAHPDITAAIQRQAAIATHISSGYGSEVRALAVEAIRSIAPPGLDRVVLGITGADANETAIKLARTATGRREVIAFGGGYLGRLSGVVGLDGKAAFRRPSGLPPDAHFFPFPSAYRWRHGDPARAGETVLGLIEDALQDPASGLGPIAAIVLEPIQGNGGVAIPPPGFLAGLREISDRHGIVLVFDEIQSGFGRTGRLWAGEHWDVTPDLMTMGKGIGGGMAVSAVVGSSAAVDGWAPGSHTSTFLTNGVNLAAATAAIGVMRRDRLWERSAALGARMVDRLRSELAETPWIGEVRGLGLFAGLEIVAPGSTAPDAAHALRIREAALARGLVLGGGGHHENVVKLAPPLTIDAALLDHALDPTIATIKETR